MKDSTEILEVPSNTKAAGFLLSKIFSTLDAGITEAFYKFLDIVEQYDNIDSKNVMAVVRRKLKSNFKGICQYIASYSHMLPKVHNKRREESIQLSQYPIQMHCVKFAP